MGPDDKRAELDKIAPRAGDQQGRRREGRARRRQKADAQATREKEAAANAAPKTQQARR